ncbi:MAG TPA: hemerythrin domain-containing protein [Thermoleophilaceae bacterium]|jgi:hemerythrin-like domain-containing protein
MRRNEALAPLSRDHHKGLFAAMKLKRAADDTAAGARGVFLAYWESDGRRHFQVEEEVLLPAWARHGAADHPAVVQVLTEHVDLRRRGGDVAAEEAPSLDQLHELGERLERHIRHEERVLFPLIETTLPEDELAELARTIEEAESVGR